MSGITQDTLSLTLAEDSYQADAQFSVSVNGVEIASGQSVTAAHSEGLSQVFSYEGDFGPGPYNVVVTFLNGENPSNYFKLDLYVERVSVNGQAPNSVAVTNGGLPSPSGTAELYNSGDSASYAVACYLRGTRIAVPGGEAAVDSLRPGDLVLTAAGLERPVVWVGHRRLAVAAAADPARVRPIRVRAGAIGPGIPTRDLLVSPEHIMLLDGVLIPAHALVNGVTVVVAAEIEAPHYFHIELESHDVLLAEGAAAESWLDAGNRFMFANAPVAALRAEPAATPAALACAPVVEAGPALDAVREQLAGRAMELGRTANAEVLRIDAPGTYRIAPEPGAAAVRLVCEAGRYGVDARRLGATVTGIAFDGVAVPLGDARLARGFHELEQHGAAAVRWTDGDALIAFGAEPPATVEIRVASVPGARAA